MYAGCCVLVWMMFEGSVVVDLCLDLSAEVEKQAYKSSSRRKNLISGSSPLFFPSALPELPKTTKSTKNNQALKSTTNQSTTPPVTHNNPFVTPQQTIMSRSATTTDILNENEFVHVINNETGTIELLEGPLRFILPANKSLVGSKQAKINLEYVF